MLMESIRESCPLTFECAIGIADIIEQEYGLQMDMSETPYLALHIGDRLESRLERKKEKISCAFISLQSLPCAKPPVMRRSRKSLRTNR